MSKTIFTKPVSAGLAFLQAAEQGCPASISERDRIELLNASMKLAVRHGFQFAEDDGQALQSMGRLARHVAFHPLDFYFEACRSDNGSYARMWEAHNRFKPWIARRGFAPEHWGQDDATRDDVVPRRNSRVATGMGVLMPAALAEKAHRMSWFDDDSLVWWVAGQSHTSITLWHYALPDKNSNPFAREGQPIQIVALSREQWHEWNSNATQHEA